LGDYLVSVLLNIKLGDRQLNILFFLFLVRLRVKTLEKVFVEEAKLLLLSVRFQNLE
jgi:hypothetical protein